jgi:exosome complex component CSL4
VFPGDVLATSEEAVPGPGAYDDGSNIVATRIGKFFLDPNEMRAVVEPLTSVPTEMRLGDFIVGEVTMVKPSMCAVEVLAVENKTRVVVGDTNGTLHVSKIARRYVKDVGNEYRLGDVVRAQIISVKPSIQVSTEDPRCGAIKALCTRCRFGLNKVDKALECPNCGRREMRNLAPDYGVVQLPPGFATLNNDA